MDETLASLMELDAFFDRLPGIQYTFWNKTAKEVLEGKYLTQPISIAIHYEELTRDRMDTFRTYFNGYEEKGMYKGVFGDLKTQIFFTHLKGVRDPDQVLYIHSYYPIPRDRSLFMVEEPEETKTEETKIETKREGVLSKMRGVKKKK